MDGLCGCGQQLGRRTPVVTIIVLSSTGLHTLVFQITLSRQSCHVIQSLSGLLPNLISAG